jgi:hypothetical protein
MVFERVHDEKPSDASQNTAVSLSDGSIADLNRNEWDAYYLFDDLCTLTAKSVLKSSKARPEGPRLLKISSITATFGLELIESILSGSANGFRSVRTDCGVSWLLLDIQAYSYPPYPANRVDLASPDQIIPALGNYSNRTSPIPCDVAYGTGGVPSSAVLL